MELDDCSSDIFHDSTADLTVKSSDGWLFKVFSRDLAAYTGAFPPIADMPVQGRDEIVLLPETAPVLELLFQFARRQRPPDIRKIAFEVLAPLAEAVEKYEVYSAIEICKALMTAKMRVHPLSVFAYAARHGYDDIRGDAAPFTLDLSFDVVRERLDTVTLLAWVAYREEWFTLLRRAHQVHSQPLIHAGGVSDCGKWRLIRERVLTELCLPSALLKISHIFGLALVEEDITSTSCSWCYKTAHGWASHIERDVKAIPAFHCFL